MSTKHLSQTKSWQTVTIVHHYSNVMKTEKSSICNTPALQAPVTALTSAAFALEVLGKAARLGNPNHTLFLLPPWASPAMLISLSHYLHRTSSTALLENGPHGKYSHTEIFPVSLAGSSTDTSPPASWYFSTTYSPANSTSLVLETAST